MVTIKDMKMPRCCSWCDLCVEDKYADKTCVLLGREWEENDYTNNHRHENCPLEDVEEPKVGQWIYKDYNWHCSKCDETPKTLGYVGDADFMRKHFKFCNHCGTKMESEE